MKLLVMGVSGSGKSTMGAALADRLSIPFIDADDLHPPENIAAMAQGEPLTDAMRWPWLDACGAAMAKEDSAVLACSALKRSYRDRLRVAVPGLRVIYPIPNRSLIEARMAARQDHFMPASLLESQCNTLETPTPDEQVIAVSIAADVPTIIADILRRL